MFFKRTQIRLGYFLFVLALFILVNPSTGVTGEIKLYLNDTRLEHIMVEQQDCSVHKGVDGKVTLGFKLGGFLFSVGPEISFGEQSGIDWDHTVQRLIARYQELCARFNTGSISKAEYEKRLVVIERIEKDAYAAYQDFLKKKARQKQDLFHELESETMGSTSQNKHENT